MKQDKEKNGGVRKPLGRFHKKDNKPKQDTVVKKTETREKVNPKHDKEVKPTKYSANKGKTQEESKESVNVLLREIINLGGTKADYDLLQQDSSDEELLDGNEENLVSEGGKIKDKKTAKKLEVEEENLSKELSKLINSLGIKKLQIEDLEQDSLEVELKQIIKEGAGTDEAEASEFEQKKGNHEKNVLETKNKDKPKDENHDIKVDSEFKETAVLAQGIDRIFSTSNIKPNQQLFKNLQRPLIATNVNWYDIVLTDLTEGPSINQQFSNELYEQAKALVSQEDELVESKSGKSSDKTFMKDIMQAGTLSDKVSALTLQIQEDPIHRIKELSKLLGMMRKNNRREALLCLASFKDLCLNNLLPNDRKLKFFEDQNISAPNLTQKHLIIWYFEDYLKKAFFDYLMISEAMSHDSVVHAKQSMLTSFYELLTAKPEQEANILTLIINKLGDKENKVASSASYLLLQTLEQHPSMKLNVIEGVEKLVMRPNISLRAQYYSVITLNQMVLFKNDTEIATKLIDIYFTLFEDYLVKPTTLAATKPDKKNRHRDKAKNKSKSNSAAPPTHLEQLEADKAKTITAVLTGVNRAFHFASIDKEKLQKHINMLFSVAYKFTFNTSIQALSLLHHILKVQPHIHNRYIKALYATLFDPRLIHSSKQALYLNLLYKSLKEEDKLSVIMAFVKRMIQASALHQPPFVTGLLFIISKLAISHPVINASIIQPEDAEQQTNKKDTLLEVKQEDSDSEVKETEEDVDSLEEIKGDDVKETTILNSLQYQARDDNPEKSNAEYTCLWELLPLTYHYHPNLVVQANKILNMETIKEQSQLHLHTLQHFLDRFAYRNPKKNSGSETKGQSIMQPLLSHYSKPGFDDNLVWAKGVSITASEQVNQKSMLKKDKKNLAADQMFFQKYFQLSTGKGSKKKSKQLDDEDDNMEDNDSTDEEAMWKEITGKTKLDDEDLEDGEDEMVDFDELDYTSDEELDAPVDGSDKLTDTAKAMTFEDMMDDDEELVDLPKHSKPTKDSKRTQKVQSEDEDSDVEMSFEEDLDEDSEADSEELDGSDDEDQSDDDVAFDFSSDDDTPQPKSKAKSKVTVGSKRITHFSSDEEDVEESKPSKSRKSKKKAKELPTFALAEDYADMLSD